MLNPFSRERRRGWPTPDRGIRRPAAVIPMCFDDQAVGLLWYLKVFDQKQHFVAVDFELFKTLSARAPTGLPGPPLFFAAGGQLPGLEAFTHLTE